MKLPDARLAEPLTRDQQVALLDAALQGRSRQEIRERLGIAARTLRCYKAPEGARFVVMPYAIRYLLEVIARENARRNGSRAGADGRARRRPVRDRA